MQNYTFTLYLQIILIFKIKIFINKLRWKEIVNIKI